MHYDPARLIISRISQLNIFFLCYLFNAVVNSSDSTVGWLMNEELKMTGVFQALSRHSLGGTEENHEGPQDSRYSGRNPNRIPYEYKV
jgi:hypothetical protein